MTFTSLRMVLAQARWMRIICVLLLANPLGLAGTALADVPVTTSELAQVLFFPSQTAPATVVTLNNARVSAEISGLLNEIAVRVGDDVAKDTVVAKIDCRDAEADLAQAAADYESSRARNKYDQSQLATAKRLLATKSISAEEIDKRRSNELVSSAQSDKSRAVSEKARLAVGRCELKAPFNAVVVARLASVGDFVSKGTPVLQLLDTDSTEVSARIQEMDLGAIKEAKAAFFESQDESYPVALRTVVPVMESRLRSYETRFTFLQEKTAPGSAGRLRWISRRPHVPADLIVDRGTLGIFLAKDGRAVFVELPGAEQGKPAPVPAELEGEIILDGRFNLTDGEPVRIEDR